MSRKMSSRKKKPKKPRRRYLHEVNSRMNGEYMVTNELAKRIGDAREVIVKKKDR